MSLSSTKIRKNENVRIDLDACEGIALDALSDFDIETERWACNGTLVSDDVAMILLGRVYRARASDAAYVKACKTNSDPDLQVLQDVSTGQWDTVTATALVRAVRNASRANVLGITRDSYILMGALKDWTLN